MGHEDEPSRRGFLEGVAVAASLVALAPGSAAAASPGTTTAAGYVVERLRQHGCDVLFGVPGATCDAMFAAAEGAGTRIVVPSTDQEAAMAADGFARTRGLGAVTVTYGPGMLGITPVVAGAYAERSPMVVINGGPSPEDLRLQRDRGSLFSHSMGRDDTDLAVLRQVTAHAARPERAADVPAAVDEAIRVALTEQRPVYVEIGKHLWSASCPMPGAPLVADRPALGGEEAVATELAARLGKAARPLVLVGIEVRRLGLQDEVTALIGRLGLPWASTLLGKAVVDEGTPGFVGVYGGARSVPAVRRAVEEADAVLALGVVLGRQLRTLATRDALLHVGDDAVRLGSSAPRPARLREVVAALAGPVRADPAWLASVAPAGRGFRQRRASVVAARPSPSEPGIPYDDVMEAVSDALDERCVVLTDTSLSMYPAGELDVRVRDGFLCDAVWQSIGWSLGAAAGAAVGSGRRPVVIVGDGGFQLTAQAVSTLVRERVPAVVLVLDNGRYGIEQWLLDPAGYTRSGAPARPYLALHRWRYAELGRALGAVGVEVDAPDALRAALSEALGRDQPTLIAVDVRPHDLPSELRS
ncbi:MAG: hypothetical protein H6738_13030 [Alphaproteobacteria bacterium]|nr:hypothetical protein [Alphaproteobacteria bacterium]MCB9697699.1 hypothetical protein [Alphaproteobacteria bacterium]